jgi:hypothetical protein
MQMAAYIFRFIVVYLSKKVWGEKEVGNKRISFYGYICSVYRVQFSSVQCICVHISPGSCIIDIRYVYVYFHCVWSSLLLLLLLLLHQYYYKYTNTITTTPIVLLLSFPFLPVPFLFLDFNSFYQLRNFRIRTRSLGVSICSDCF